MHECKLHRIEAGSLALFLLAFDETFNSERYLHKLTDFELERYFTFKNNKRRNEFVATRLLKHDLFGFNQIRYKDHGAPYIEDEGYISISHANLMVGIAFCPYFQVGFDVEEIDDKVLKVHSKFLNEHEYGLIDSSSTEELIMAWSFKETLYKLAGRKEIDFKKDLLLLTKEENCYTAKICNPDEYIHVELGFQKFGNYMLTYNRKAVNYGDR